MQACEVGLVVPRCDTATVVSGGRHSEAVPNAPRGEQLSASPDGRPQVLVADRQQEIVELVAHVLDRAGLRFVAAHDAGSALALFAAHRPPVVVLDTVGLGLGVLERLSSTSPHTAVIVLSARDAEDARAAAFELGAVDYFIKPFSHRDLVARIRACLPPLLLHSGG